MRIYLNVREGQIAESSIAKGRVQMDSLFLIYHDAERKTRKYEFLKLYIYHKPRTQLEKTHNKETMDLAENIRARKVLDMQANQHGFVSSFRGKVGILTYFGDVVEKRYNADIECSSWKSTLVHLTNFCKKDDIPIERIDELFLERFRDYLLTAKVSVRSRNQKISQNTAVSYFNKLKTALKEAYQSKMIRENPCVRVKGIKELDTHREYLTFEELQMMANTECGSPLIKRAFIFSALTGLRFSDVKALHWENIKYDTTNGWSIVYTQKKTKSREVLPIHEQAVALLGKEGRKDVQIFKGLRYNAYNNKRLAKWVKDSGIDKHITFHCARHSFATLQLTMGTDIYTVSKLLGHRNVQTTQIYGHIINKKKIEAASRLPLLEI